MKNCFANSAFAILLMFIFCIVGTAQENCELASKSAPLLLNLQIGMSPEQTQSLFGRDLKIKIKKKGERTFFQNFIKNPAPNTLSGVRALYLRFLDKKLYQIEIFYEPRQDLKTVEDIAGALSLQMNFPASVWQVKNRRAQINCGELSLSADSILNPRIEFTNETIRTKIEEARKEKSER